MYLGGLMMSYSVNERTRLATIGPDVKMRKPKIHGARNAYAAHVSLLRNPLSQRRALVREPGACERETAVNRSSAVGPVERGLRRPVRLAQRLRRRLLAVQHAVH